jgi:RNA recognition motif-containing protein
VGANVFIGNLDPEVDEKLLYDTFSAFGVILQTPKVKIAIITNIFLLLLFNQLLLICFISKIFLNSLIKSLCFVCFFR